MCTNLTASTTKGGGELDLLTPSDARMGPYDRFIGKGNRRRGVWDRQLPTSKINDIGNMRTLVLEHVQDLATSMKSDGQQMPILVNRRKLAKGRIAYERIDGEHRWRGCILNDEQVMSTIFDNLPPQETMHRMLSANIHLDPDSLEWANKIQQTYVYWRTEKLGEASVAAFCRETGLSATRVHNALRVIEGLNPEALEIYKRGDIQWGTIVELARIEDQALQFAWAIEAVNADLSHLTMRKRVSRHLESQRTGELELGGLFGGDVETYREPQQLVEPILERATLHYIDWLSRVIRLVEDGKQPTRVFTPKRVKAVLELEGSISWLKSNVPVDSEKEGDI